MRRGVFLLAGVLLAIAAECRSFRPDGDFVIAERGRQAECTIVYAQDAGPVVEYAAEELRDYVKKLTGVELTVNGKAPQRIVLEHGGLCDVPPDGFAIRTTRDGELRISGTNPRGCLYGVYDLLERYGGVGFYSSWCEKVPQLARLAVPADTVGMSAPAFAMREPYWYDLNQHKEFSAKLRVNGYNHVKGEVPAKLGGDDFRFGGGLSSCHTFAKLCDPEVYFDKHPEYFSLVKGKRLKKGTQLCLTNPDVLDIVTSNVLARIRQDPGAKFYGVSQNDWYNYCECEKCKAVDDEEGSHAGTMVRFVNAVAERVEREFPDVLIETLAYQYTRKPPKKTRLRHNVVPCLCTIELDFAHAIPESPYLQNKDFMSDIVGWGRQTDQLYVWDYVTQFTHYPCPFANVYALQGNIRFFRENGVKMLFEQGAREGYHAGFAELKAWLLAKLMWNPDADVKALLDEFFDGYYGKAAPFVREYFEELHRRQRTRSADPKCPLCIFDGVDSPPYDDPAFMAWADGLWLKAEQAVAGTEPYGYNVKMGRFSHLYVKLEVKRAKRKDAELREDPESVELARWLLKAKSEARGPMQVREWSEKERIAGWREIASEARIDALIAEKEPKKTREMFVDYYANASNLVFKANPDFWGAKLDFSCLSVWNTSKEPHSHGGTLISPWHVLFSKHWYLGKGNALYFRDRTGKVLKRDIADVRHVGGTDLTVGLLQEPVNEIEPVRLLATNEIFRIKKGEPVVVINQDKYATIADLRGFGAKVDPLKAAKFGFVRSHDRQREGFFVRVRSNDSSSPTFLVDDKGLVLIGLHWEVGEDANITAFMPAIQKLMDELHAG